MDSQGSELPAWASLDFDVAKWWSLLDNYGIDDAARQNLFMLGQRGQLGKYEALELLTKLQHKGYKTELDNSSK